MQELLFWLIILPTMSLIAVLVLFREQLFNDRFRLLLRGFCGFFVELAEVYDHWYFWFAYEVLQEIEQQRASQLTYTPLLPDEPVEKEEEPICTKLCCK